MSNKFIQALTVRSVDFARTLMVIHVIFLLSGCHFPPSERSPGDPPLWLEKVDISLDSDANLDSATAIDLLIVYKKDLLNALMKMQASDYYASASQIRRDYPDMVDIWHWELTPGQVITNYPASLRCDDPAGAIVFANYLTPGDHRIRIGSSDHIHIRLRRYDFCVLEQGCESSTTQQRGRETATGKEKKTEAISGSIKSAQKGNNKNPASTIKDLKKDLSDIKGAAKSVKSLFSK